MCVIRGGELLFMKKLLTTAAPGAGSVPPSGRVAASGCAASCLAAGESCVSADLMNEEPSAWAAACAGVAAAGVAMAARSGLSTLVTKRVPVEGAAGVCDDEDAEAGVAAGV